MLTTPDTYLYGAVVSIHQHTFFPHPASNVYVLFKLQPWTVEPGHLGPLFPRAKLDNDGFVIVFAQCITNLTTFLWPAISEDASHGFSHNLIFMQ